MSHERASYHPSLLSLLTWLGLLSGGFIFFVALGAVSSFEEVITPGNTPPQSLNSGY
jgi:hypothetical protein